MNGPKKIKFGIIGCSRVAQRGMIPGIVDAEFAELAMIGSRDQEKAKEIGAQYGIKKWGSYNDVMASPDIDGVYISLPNSLHEEWTIKALEAGKHVLCEKPAALSYTAAQRMVEAAKKNNVRLLEGLMFRYHPQNAKVRELIAGGALGDILRFDGCFAYAMPAQESNAMSKELGGGSFNDQMCYLVSASRMVFEDEPESVLCNIEIDPQSGVSVRADITLMFPGNKSAFCSSLFGSYYQSTYSILGTKAHLRMGRAYAVPRDMSTKIFFDVDDKMQEINFEPSNHFQFMVDDFAGEILKGGKSTKDYEAELLRQAKVMEAARISSEEKRVVKVSEII